MTTKEHEKVLKALANKRRLEIVKFLKERKEANVGEVATHIKLSFKATSKHLSILTGAEILETEARSILHFHFLNPRAPSLAKAIISIL